MLCTHNTTTSASLDYLSQAYQPVSPSILNHFRWELYQAPLEEVLMCLLSSHTYLCDLVGPKV